MTHASDLTYLTRAVFTAWTFLWFLQRVWSINRFEALRWNRIKKFELKSSITILLFVMCPLMLTYDVAVTYIKYNEGFLIVPTTGDIITKPEEYWSDFHKQMAGPLDYVFGASFSVQTCLLFLLQSFWNYLANNIAKTSFMGSFEFKSYMIYSIFSFALFPLLQWIFHDNEIYTEAVPQLAYGTIMFIIALLGVRSNQRFSRLLGKSKASNPSQVNIVAKLEYFKEMNQYLTCALFIGSASVVALSVDALTPARFLNTHKFTIDILITHANFTIWVVFVTLILIFYPSACSFSDMSIGKDLPSTIVVKSMKCDLLEPPNGKRWSKYIPVSENSPWSSQVSSRNDRASWYLDMPDNMSSNHSAPTIARNHHNHNSGVYQSNDGSVTLDLFPPQPTSSRGDRSSRGVFGDTPSSFYFASNTLLPSPTYPPPTVNSNSVLPLQVTTQHNHQRSVSFSKPSPSESLKYPSSPVRNRNSLSSLSSLPTFPPPITPPPTTSPPPIPTSGSLPSIKSVPVAISDALPTSSLMELPKRTQISALKDASSAPVIRITDSLTSLRSKALSQKIEGDTSVESKALRENNGINMAVSENSTINSITKLDTRVVAPFMFQDTPPLRVVTTVLVSDKNENDALNVEQKKNTENGKVIGVCGTRDNPEKYLREQSQTSEESDNSNDEKKIPELSSREDSQEEVQSDSSSNTDDDPFALEKSLIQYSPSIRKESGDENSLSTPPISSTSPKKSKTSTLTITTETSLKATPPKLKSLSRTGTVTTSSSSVASPKSALKSVSSSSSKSPASKSRRPAVSPVSSERSSKTPSPTSPSTPFNSRTTTSRASTSVNRNSQKTSLSTSARVPNASNNNKSRMSSTRNGVEPASDIRNRVIKSNNNISETAASGDGNTKHVDSEGVKRQNSVTGKPYMRGRSDSGFHGDDFDLIVPSESSYLEIGKNNDSKNERTTNSSEKNSRPKNEKTTGSKGEKNTSKNGKTASLKDGRISNEKISKNADVKADKSNRSSLKDVKKIMGKIKSSRSLSTSSSESSSSSSSSSKAKKVGSRVSRPS